MNGRVEIWKCQKEEKSEWQVWMICALAGYYNPGTSTCSFSGHLIRKPRDSWYKEHSTYGQDQKTLFQILREPDK